MTTSAQLPITRRRHALFITMIPCRLDVQILSIRFHTLNLLVTRAFVSILVVFYQHSSIFPCTSQCGGTRFGQGVVQGTVRPHVCGMGWVNTTRAKSTIISYKGQGAQTGGRSHRLERRTLFPVHPTLHPPLESHTWALSRGTIRSPLNRHWHLSVIHDPIGFKHLHRASSQCYIT